MPSSSNSSGVAAVRMAVDAGSPAEVAANTPAKTFGEVGGVKGAVSPSQSAQSHRKRWCWDASSNVTVWALQCHL
jgi:hypothetical protein